MARAEAPVVTAGAGGAPAEPDPDDLGVAVVAQDPDRCAGISAAAGRHSGGEVLVLAVAGRDGAALLSGGDAGAADGLARSILACLCCSLSFAVWPVWRA